MEQGPQEVRDAARPNVAEVSALYLATLTPPKRLEAQAEVVRFAHWYGATLPFQEIRGHDLQRYVEEIAVAASGAQRLQILRSYFAYAYKEGWTATNLASHLRPSKAGRRADASIQAPARETPRLTAQGYAALQEELESLRSRRPQVAAELKRAMADKDFRENSPLEAMREHQAHLEARIRDLEAVVKGAVMVTDESPRGETKVHLGSTVVLCNLATGSKVRYTVVDPTEVNTALGKISVLSPVGRAVVERAPGEEIEVAAPVGAIRFRIEAIEG